MQIYYIKSLRLVFLFYCIVFVVLEFSGVYRHRLWGQVESLWISGTDLGQLFGHIHVYRYIIALPGFYLDGFLGGGLGQSVYITIFALINFYLFYKLMQIYAIGRPAASVYFVLFFLFFLAHVFMNGRGVFAWCSWLTLIYAFSAWRYRDLGRLMFFVLVLLAIGLATVSTGVFIVVFSTALWLLIYVYLFSLRSGGQFFLIPLPLLVVYFGWDYLGLAITKNVEYYDGILGVLRHGYGALFGELDFILHVLLLITAVAVIALMLLFYKTTRLQLLRQLLFFLSITVVAGVAGYTMLTLAVPVILLVLCVFLSKATSSRNLILRLQGSST